jgi:hypothetical protein
MYIHMGSFSSLPTLSKHELPTFRINSKNLAAFCCVGDTNFTAGNWGHRVLRRNISGKSNGCIDCWNLEAVNATEMFALLPK